MFMVVKREFYLYTEVPNFGSKVSTLKTQLLDYKWCAQNAKGFFYFNGAKWRMAKSFEPLKLSLYISFPFL